MMIRDKNNTSVLMNMIDNPLHIGSRIIVRGGGRGSKGNGTEGARTGVRFSNFTKFVNDF